MSHDDDDGGLMIQLRSLH